MFQSLNIFERQWCPTKKNSIVFLPQWVPATLENSPIFLFDKSSQPKDLEAHLKMDQQHLWHPYTSMVKPTRVWPVHSADGCNLHLEDGRHLVDGMASWWCAIHGYNVPELNAAATKQLSKMSHAPWADFFQIFSKNAIKSVLKQGFEWGLFHCLFILGKISNLGRTWLLKVGVLMFKESLNDAWRGSLRV